MDGNKLKSERRKNLLSQRELAEKVGVTRNTINSIENGYTNPSLALLERIANELGCSLKKFF